MNGSGRAERSCARTHGNSRSSAASASQRPGGSAAHASSDALRQCVVAAAASHYAAAFEISMALRVPKFDQAELDAAAARRMAGGG